MKFQTLVLAIVLTTLSGARSVFASDTTLLVCQGSSIQSLKIIRKSNDVVVAELVTASGSSTTEYTLGQPSTTSDGSGLVYSGTNQSMPTDSLEFSIEEAWGEDGKVNYTYIVYAPTHQVVYEHVSCS